MRTPDRPSFIAATLPPAQQWEGKTIWRADLKCYQQSNGLSWVPAVTFNQATGNLEAAGVAVAGAVNVVGPKALTLVQVGDSFAGQSVRLQSVSGMTCSNGVITVPATAHGIYSGTKVSITGTGIPAYDVIQASATRLDANTFTVPAGVGAPNGTLTAGKASTQILMFDRMQPVGAATHLLTLSDGGITIPQIAGFPGYSTADVVSEFDRSVTPYGPDIVLVTMGYNSVNAGIAEDTIYNDYVNIINRINAIGAVAMVASIFPWLTGAAANSSGNRLKMQSLNRRIAALCASNSRARYLDYAAKSTDANTGLARTNWVAAADAAFVHMSTLAANTLAQLAVAAITNIRPHKLVSSKEDSRAGDAASLNVARTMPAVSTGGGGAGSNVNSPWTNGGTVTTGQYITGGSTSPNVYYVSTGGTLGAGAPSHTSGSAANGTATLDYVGTNAAGNYAAATSGVCAGLTVSGTSIPTNGAVAWIEAAPNGGPGYVQKARFSLDANGDAGRISQTLTAADFTLGETVDVFYKSSLLTSHNASNRTPAGQNVTAVQAQVVFEVDSVLWTPNNWNSTVPVGESLQADIVDKFQCLPNVVVPQGTAMTTTGSYPRLDYIVTVGGAGNFEMSVYCYEVRKRA